MFKVGNLRSSHVPHFILRFSWSQLSVWFPNHRNLQCRLFLRPILCRHSGGHDRKNEHAHLESRSMRRHLFRAVASSRKFHNNDYCLRYHIRLRKREQLELEPRLRGSNVQDGELWTILCYLLDGCGFWNSHGSSYRWPDPDCEQWSVLGTYNLRWLVICGGYDLLDCC